jgi:hypothetical protein
MEEEEYNDIVTYIQDQKYPQNAETSNVLIYKYHHSILVSVYIYLPVNCIYKIFSGCVG